MGHQLPVELLICSLPKWSLRHQRVNVAFLCLEWACDCAVSSRKLLEESDASSVASVDAISTGGTTKVSAKASSEAFTGGELLGLWSQIGLSTTQMKFYFHMDMGSLLIDGSELFQSGNVAQTQGCFACRSGECCC